MAIQPTPPIQLDPSMDRGHELAFINQNFNNIASVIGQNSFVIVSSGTATVAGAVFTTGGAFYATTQKSTTITHNLGYVPSIMAFATDAGGTTYQSTPNYRLMQLSTTGYVTDWINFTVDTTTLYIFHNIMGYNSSVTINDINIKYYLLQQTAN